MSHEACFSPAIAYSEIRVHAGVAVSPAWLRRESRERVVWERVVLVDGWKEGLGLTHQNSLQVSTTIIRVSVKIVKLFWAFFFFFLYKSRNSMHQIKRTFSGKAQGSVLDKVRRV